MNRKSKRAFEKKHGFYPSMLDLIEFGFYNQRLKPIKGIDYLHTLWKKNKGNIEPFKKMYSEYFPDGITIEEWRVNPQCEKCDHFSRHKNEGFCAVLREQAKPACKEFKKAEVKV